MSQALTEALLRFTARRTVPSPFFTAIDGVIVIRADHANPPTFRISRPAICIVAQGAKWATFGGSRFEYRAGEALVVSVAAPSVGRVTEASPERPCLCLLIELDPAVMRDVAEGLQPLPRSGRPAPRGVFVTDFQGPLADCARRMMQLLETPRAIGTLAPMIMREICYWLLTGPQGGEVAAICLASGASHRVVQAMNHLRDRFAETVRVEDLAAVARLSVSAFHRQFKALTALTPVQYQKQMRLLKARQLMAADALSAERAALTVGYESPSQFSRDYARMFGLPPKRDVRQRIEALIGDAAPLG